MTKWRRIQPVDREVVLTEHVGGHRIEVERGMHGEKIVYRALHVMGDARVLLGLSLHNPDAALRQAARCLGYEPAPDAVQGDA